MGKAILAPSASTATFCHWLQTNLRNEFFGLSNDIFHFTIIFHFLNEIGHKFHTQNFLKALKIFRCMGSAVFVTADGYKKYQKFNNFYVRKK